MGSWGCGCYWEVLTRPHLSGDQAGGRERVPAAALGCLPLPSTPSSAWLQSGPVMQTWPQRALQLPATPSDWVWGQVTQVMLVTANEHHPRDFVEAMA